MNYNIFFDVLLNGGGGGGKIPLPFSPIVWGRAVLVAFWAEFETVVGDWVTCGSSVRARRGVGPF